jgi:hypothetical protein
VNERVYLALVHHPTLDRQGKVVATAVTTLDLHDFARLARTYGLGGVLATTPLEGQRTLVGKLLSHWVGGPGGEANPWRREALQQLQVVASLGEARDEVARRWGEEPLLVGTSARGGSGRVSFADARARLRAASRGVLVVFGTGWGLTEEALGECAWVLEPVAGQAGYNHLSVRSAASVVVDRLFGER